MIIDVTVLLLIVLAIFKGYSKGLIVALFMLVAYMLGLAAAVKLSALVASYFGAHSGMGKGWLTIISFALVLIAVVLVVRLLAALVEKTVQLALLGWLNRLGGILLFMLLYLTLLSVVLFYANQIQLLGADMLRSSVTWPFIKPIGPAAIDLLGKLLPVFRGMFHQLEDFFGQVAQKAAAK